MEDKLKDQIEKVVTAIFASKEEDTKRKKTEDALHASADKLTAIKEELATVTQRNQEQASVITDLDAKVVTLQEEKAAIEQKFQEELAAVTEAKVAIDTEFAKLNLEFSTLKTELLADARMAALEKAGVVRVESAMQKDKVKLMSDEEFEAYKEELAAIKAQVVASLTAKKEEAATPVVEEAIVEDTVVPPANVDSTKSVQAALNLETTPSQDLISKYKDLGEALAKNITKK